MSLPLTRRQRNVLIACAAVGAGGYISYKIYTSPSVARKRRQLYRFFDSLSSLLEAAAKGGDCAGLLWKDLHTFLLTDKDEVPQSLKQLLKVGQTREFQISVAALCRSVTHGVVSSLARNGPSLSDGSEYGSALYEELSFRKDGLRKTGKTGGELGYRENRDARLSWKDRRLRLSGETDGSQHKEAYEDDDGAVKRDRMERSDSASRIDGEEDEDEAGRYSAWMTSRNYYRASSTEIAGEGGKGKSRSQGDRRVRGEGKAEGLPERLVSKFFTEAGKGFASAVVASAARSIVLSVLEGMQEKEWQDRKQQAWNSTDWSPEAWKEKDSAEKGMLNDGKFQDSPRKPVFNEPASGNSMQENLLEFASSGKGKALIADCIETFIGTAVSVYLAKTRDVNFYEDMVASVVKPAHRVPVKDLLTSVCNGAVETFVRTSHEVISAGSSGPSASEPECSVVEIDSPVSNGIPVFTLDKPDYFSDSGHPLPGDDGSGKGEEHVDNLLPLSSAPCTPDYSETQSLPISGLKNVNISFDHTPQVDKVLRVDSDKLQEVMLLPSSGRENSGKSAVKADKLAGVSKNWVDGISRTLAVPSNRALVLDVAGTVTHEAVRSAIEVIGEKVSQPFRSKKKEAPKDEKPSTSTVVKFVNKTGDLAVATASKAMVVMTMCLALCLHTLVGPARYAQAL